MRERGLYPGLQEDDEEYNIQKVNKQQNTALVNLVRHLALSRVVHLEKWANEKSIEVLRMRSFYQWLYWSSGLMRNSRYSMKMTVWAVTLSATAYLGGFTTFLTSAVEKAFIKTPQEFQAVDLIRG